MPPSSSPPSPSPTAPFEQPRSFCGLMPTWYVWQEPNPSLPSLAAIPFESSPIALAVPAPSSASKMPMRLGSVGLTCEILQYRSTTRSLKLLDPTFSRATVLLAAQHEAAEARWLDLPFGSPSVI